MHKKYFSYSKINTYKSCPQKYKIVYLDKIRKKNESIEAFMGKRVHEVLEWLYSDKNRKKKLILFDTLMNKYKQLWNDKWHQNIFIARCKYNRENYNKNTLYEIGIDCLSNYYRLFNKNGYFNQNVEDVELSFETKIENYLFKGFIDRVDIKDDVIDIIDYKTGKNKRTYYQAKNDFQLAIYGLAAKQIFKKYKKIKLTFYNLRESKKEDMITSIDYDAKKLEQLEFQIKKKIFDINNDKEYIAKESLLCEWCYLWEECEIKSTGNPSINI